ncbi:MAG: sugar phosphate nucleotidyltransferase [Steroidobacteraceae bacterium]
MKVVLFCGGLGTRLREHSDTIPKPLVPIGTRPIIWHLMRYYAHFGHKDFILCLGYRGDLIREYFLQYSEYVSNDFTMSEGGRRLQLHSSDIHDWRITFVDTGMHSNIGQRLLRVRSYLRDEPAFLANYSDGLGDIALDKMIADFGGKDAVASFASVQPQQTFHLVDATNDGHVRNIRPMQGNGSYLNGGYFILRQSIFDYLHEGEELVEEPFQRLISERKLITWHHDGFWQPMDTFKDKVAYDRMEARGECPWMLWKTHPAQA